MTDLKNVGMNCECDVETSRLDTENGFIRVYDNLEMREILIFGNIGEIFAEARESLRNMRAARATFVNETVPSRLLIHVIARREEVNTELTVDFLRRILRASPLNDSRIVLVVPDGCREFCREAGLRCCVYEKHENALNHLARLD